MTHTYTITGMTCDSCQAKVQHLIQNVEGVTKVKIDWRKEEADITMNKHIQTFSLQAALNSYPKYQLSDKINVPKPLLMDGKKTWLQIYRPILIIFGYVSTISISLQLASVEFNWMKWMNHFMAGFFLTFSFFKFLNLRGFADSYSSYDIIAKHWRPYGFIYAFIELSLGLAYLLNFNPVFTNAVTTLIMSISLIGVLQSLFNHRKIKCACLGDVFNLPMSTITVIEDGLMIVMSIIMLVSML